MKTVDLSADYRPSSSLNEFLEIFFSILVYNGCKKFAGKMTPLLLNLPQIRPEVVEKYFKAYIDTSNEELEVDTLINLIFNVSESLQHELGTYYVRRLLENNISVFNDNVDSDERLVRWFSNGFEHLLLSQRNDLSKVGAVSYMNELHVQKLLQLREVFRKFFRFSKRNSLFQMVPLSVHRQLGRSPLQSRQVLQRVGGESQLCYSARGHGGDPLEGTPHP